MENSSGVPDNLIEMHQRIQLIQDPFNFFSFNYLSSLQT